MGNSNESINSVAIEVFTSAPGSSITDKQKMPRIIRIRYWPS